MRSSTCQPQANAWLPARAWLRWGAPAGLLLVALTVLSHPASPSVARAAPLGLPATALSPTVAVRSSCPFDPSLLTSAPASLPSDTTIYIVVGSTEQADELQAEVAQADQTRAAMGLPPLNVQEVVILPGDAGDELLAAQAQLQAAIAASGPAAACLIDQRTPIEPFSVTP